MLNLPGLSQPVSNGAMRGKSFRRIDCVFAVFRGPVKAGAIGSYRKAPAWAS
jgi:hypothetical protein